MKKTQERDEFIRKRIERQRKIRKRRLKIFFCFLIITLIAVSAVLCLTVFFPIEKISAEGSAIYTADEIIESSGIKIGDNLFTASKSTALKELKSKLPYIDSVSFKRKLPSTLKISVTDAEEFAAYYIGKKYYTVSKSGWVLSVESKKPKKIFIVKGADAECEVGREIVFNNTEQSELINRISNTVSKENLELDSINIKDTLQIKIGVENRFEVLIGTENSLEEKLRHLSGMIKNIDKEKSGKINLSMWENNNPQGTFKPENSE